MRVLWALGLMLKPDMNLQTFVTLRHKLSLGEAHARFCDNGPQVRVISLWFTSQEAMSAKQILHSRAMRPQTLLVVVRACFVTNFDTVCFSFDEVLVSLTA